MKVMIDISEEMYKEYMSIHLARGNGKGIVSTLLTAIQKGTPLPEHHGDLIDRDELLTWSHKMDTMYCIYDEVVDVGDIKNAPTIIERSDSE